MRFDRILIVVLGLTVAGLVWMRPRQAISLSAPRAAGATTQIPVAPPNRAAELTPAAESTASAPERERDGDQPASEAAGALTAGTTAKSDDDALEQAVDLLVSSTATFQQKQATWAQLRMAGQLGQVITALEQRQAADQTSAEIPTALGMAYLMSASATQDVREQGIDGMKADLDFDAALKLDPSNWDAAYLKASALSHWPDSLQVGPQVIQRLAGLIDQQEAQPIRPEFVMSYILLGDQYQKSGQSDDARQIWSRGLALFPGFPTLTQRLNPAP